MKLLYINPNSTAAMTESIVAAARKAVPEAEVIGWTNLSAPPAIQGPEDGAAAVPGLLSLLPAAREAGADAIVIACFDDTGLDEMRRAAHCPVLGIGQAAYTLASLLGKRFAVVTTLPVSVPVIEGNISRRGFSPNCSAVRASGLGVLEVESGGEKVFGRLSEEIADARAAGAEVAILGCAGMAHLADDLARKSALPLIDGVAASASLAMATARLSPRVVPALS